MELQLNTDIIRERQSKRPKFGITTIFRQNYTMNKKYGLTPVFRHNNTNEQETWNNTHIQTKQHQ